jgi:hypothetical protein
VTPRALCRETRPPSGFSSPPSPETAKTGAASPQWLLYAGERVHRTGSPLRVYVVHYFTIQSWVAKPPVWEPWNKPKQILLINKNNLAYYFSAKFYTWLNA